MGLMVFLIIQKPFLHIDEWFTMGLLNIPFRGMVFVTAKDVHPPLYYFIVMVPVRILNILNIKYNLIFVMKIMSVIPYAILLLISLFKIRKDHGWLAGGLFAFTVIAMSSFFTDYSIARMYPWGMLFLVLSYIFAGEILKESKLKYWILLAFFSVCGAYTHYFVAVGSVVLYFLLFLYYLINNRSELKNWLISTVCGIICFLPWSLILWDQMKEVHGSYWIPEITLNTLIEFMGFVSAITSEFALNIIFTVLFIVAFIVLLVQYRKSPKENEFPLLGFLVFLGTLVFGVVVSMVFKPILVDRYLLPSIGLVWLGFSVFISKYDFKKVILPLVIVLLVIGAFNIYEQTLEIDKNHDALVKNQEFLESINNNDSVVIIDGMVKYVHFHDQLNETIVFGGFSVDEHKNAKDFAKYFDNKTYRFCIPDDFDTYKNKTVYFAIRKGSDIDLPPYVSYKKVGKVENCIFYKLTYHPDEYQPKNNNESK